MGNASRGPQRSLRVSSRSNRNAHRALRVASSCAVDVLEKRVFLSVVPAALSSPINFTHDQHANFTDADGTAVEMWVDGDGAGIATPDGAGDISNIQTTGNVSRVIVSLSGGADGGTKIPSLTGSPELQLRSGGFRFSIVGPHSLQDIEFVNPAGGEKLLRIGTPVQSADTVDLFLPPVSDLQIDSLTPIRDVHASGWTDTNSTKDHLIAPSIRSFYGRGALQADVRTTQNAGTLRYFTAGDVSNVVLALGETPATLSSVQIKELRVASWNDGSIHLGSIGSINSAGDFTADVTVDQTQDNGAFGRSFGRLNIAGDLIGSNIQTAGEILSINLGGIQDSSISAGVSGGAASLPDTDTGFDNFSIGSFTAGQFVNSNVASKRIGAIDVDSVADGASTGKFGFAAKSIGSYRRGSAIFSNLLIPGDNDPVGNYIARIVGPGTPNGTPDANANLANDTGSSSTDRISSDPTISGTLKNAQLVNSFKAGLDAADPSSFTDILGDVSPAGAFSLDRARLEQIGGAALTEGQHTLHLLALGSAGATLASKDVVFTLDTVAPTITAKSPSDTSVPAGSADVDVTFSEAVTGLKAADLALSGAGAAGATVAAPTNVSGNLWRFAVSGLVAGPVSATFAPVSDPAGNASASTTWNFTVAGAVPSPEASADLANDTGSSNTDRITKDPTISGTLKNAQLVAAFKASFDAVPATQTDILADVGTDGTFSLNRARLEQIAGAPLAEGQHTLHLLALDAAEATLASKDVVFTLDTTAPTITAKTPSGTSVPPGSTNVDVTFSEPVTGLKGSDLTLSGAGAAGASVAAPTNVSGNVWRFAVSGLVTGPVNVTLASVNDRAANASASTNWNFTVATPTPTFVDPVFDVAALTATPLNAKSLSKTESNGIVTEEVMYHSETFNGVSVDIFAILAYPKNATNLPAIIWNQGGLSQADANIITSQAAQRGYLGMCIDFPLPGYRSTGGFNIVAGLNQTPDPFDADISRGVVALLKAVSFLQTRPEVDPDKIGMAGSSWGGFYTTLMAGVDPRIKAASSMFGTGELQTGNLWWDTGGRSSQFDATAREKWRTTLDPAFRLTKRDTPIGFFSGTDDQFYWMPALTKTYNEVIGPRHLTLTPSYNHALDGALFDEVFEFLDVHLKGATPLLAVSPLSISKANGKLTATFTIENNGSTRTPQSANVILSFGDDGNWPSRAWKTIPANINGNTVTAELPNGPINYYVSGTLFDTDGFNTSTPLVFVDVAAQGVKDPSLKLDYNGTAPWGGFEPDQIFFIEANTFFTPTTSTDAHSGAQSMILTSAVTLFRQLEFTDAVPHRLTLWLKSDAPSTPVQVQLQGDFDGVPLNAQTSPTIGTVWTQVTLDYNPPQALSASLNLQITVPAGVQVKLDDVSFSPVE